MKDEEVRKAVRQAYEILEERRLHGQDAVASLAGSILIAQASERSMNYLISKVMEK